MSLIHANDLDAYMTENGYTRGLAERGKMVLVGPDVRIAVWDSLLSYEISDPIASLAEAEAIVGNRRPVSRQFAEAAAFEQYLIDNDGPNGHGW